MLVIIVTSHFLCTVFSMGRREFFGKWANNNTKPDHFIFCFFAFVFAQNFTPSLAILLQVAGSAWFFAGCQRTIVAGRRGQTGKFGSIVGHFAGIWLCIVQPNQSAHNANIAHIIAKHERSLQTIPSGIFQRQFPDVVYRGIDKSVICAGRHSPPRTTDWSAVWHGAIKRKRIAFEFCQFELRIYARIENRRRDLYGKGFAHVFGPNDSIDTRHKSQTILLEPTIRKFIFIFFYKL